MNMVLTNPVTAPAQAIRQVTSPRPPHSIADTGLSETFLLALLVKSVYRMGLEYPTEVAGALRLPANVVQHLVEQATDLKLMEALGQDGGKMRAEMRYSLTAKGREWALEALAQSQYVGPAPVPLQQYAAQMQAQSIRGERLSMEMLQEVFRDLTLSPALMEEIGPAVNSGASLLLYGPPGNGKSSIAEAICEAYRDRIYVPHAIEVDQQVITIYDPTVHAEATVEQDAGQQGLRRQAACDPRYVRCRRPVVVTGGELGLEMLDLAYSPVSGFYEAPIQMKASGGVFVVDDLGRQRHTPQQLVNRLIVPLEKRTDFLSLQSGRKFEVPFDTLVIFSTNMAPSTLADGAALRRLRYKILIDRPETDIYVEIFRRAADRAGMALPEGVIPFVLDELYTSQPGAEPQAFHPRFLIDQVKSICLYEGVEPSFTKDYLRRAWRNLFPKD